MKRHTQSQARRKAAEQGEPTPERFSPANIDFLNSTDFIELPEPAEESLKALGYTVRLDTGPRGYIEDGWIVTGSNGEHKISAHSRCPGEAWRRALEQALAGIVPTVIVEATKP